MPYESDQSVAVMNAADGRPGGHAYLFGLGSPHGGDRLGWRAIEWLGEALREHDDLTVARLAQPVDLFLHTVTANDRLLLVDAMRGQGPPGTLKVFAPAELPPAAASLSSLSSHGLDLAGTLALVEALGLFRAGIRIIGIEMPAEAGPDTPDAEMSAPGLNAAQAKRLYAAVLDWLDAG
ncbi:hydrogenase maturation protease [Halomonas fontilapidosi]|uniref:Hydrogenase maturation protease n=1 Tax=Halomonas fontilapidosi TaxID=616675 RepID=A0A7W5DIT1_9GAMM|nr:hydrogenase maturation protease [Halomonas fontilapidosi]MBB3183715.1 hydrogenase maturation protease [Halomonas fontilapidosi]